MKIPIQITISRNSDDLIHISLKDPKAVLCFAKIQMTPHDFTMAVTGMAAIEAEGFFQGLEKVGKIRVREPRTKLCTDSQIKYDRTELEEWLLREAQEEGWELDSYLGSKDSRTPTPDGVLLHYSVSRWEEAK